MPTYQYRCSSCGHDLEAVQSFTDDSLVDCPACGEPALRKVFGNVGVVFKGPGFYRTDSRKEGSPAGKQPAKEGAAKKDGAISTESSKAGATGPATAKPTGDSKGATSAAGKPAGSASG